MLWTLKSWRVIRDCDLQRLFYATQSWKRKGIIHYSHEFKTLWAALKSGEWLGLPFLHLGLLTTQLLVPTAAATSIPLPLGLQQLSPIHLFPCSIDHWPLISGFKLPTDNNEKARWRLEQLLHGGHVLQLTWDYGLLVRSHHAAIDHPSWAPTYLPP